jgi:cold shock protein
MPGAMFPLTTVGNPRITKHSQGPRKVCALPTSPRSGLFSDPKDVCSKVAALCHVVDDFDGKTMNTGTVRWFSYSKGCGFIVPDDGGADVFAHFSGFCERGARSLHPDQRVRYSVRAGPKGAVASNIRSLG